MLIPVRCFTCGSVISDKWIAYEKIVAEERSKNKEKEVELLDIDMLESGDKKITAEYKALNDLNVVRICCRRHFLTNVDMIELI
jgi:DNA-directed RNA polymerase I, II, and III subunit RPABC5